MYNKIFFLTGNFHIWWRRSKFAHLPKFCTSHKTFAYYRFFRLFRFIDRILAAIHLTKIFSTTCDSRTNFHAPSSSRLSVCLRARKSFIIQEIFVSAITLCYLPLSWTAGLGYGNSLEDSVSDHERVFETSRIAARLDFAFAGCKFDSNSLDPNCNKPVYCRALLLSYDPYDKSADTRSRTTL